jgi:hypothetical protein
MGHYEQPMSGTADRRTHTPHPVWLALARAVLALVLTLAAATAAPALATPGHPAPGAQNCARASLSATETRAGTITAESTCTRASSDLRSTRTAAGCGGAAKARPNAIGFAPGTGRSALSDEGRLQHASRHLQEAGVLPGWKGKTSPELYRQKVAPILERPQATFDDTLGGVPTKVFTGQIDGHDVALHVFKQGKHQGQIGTGVVPQGQQRAKWGFE